MKFTGLRLTGFKSFVETTDFEIREGLTGIVGPNGCGKSNLLEALRWVMGATSAKALRGDAMSSVIFSGTTMRPARNWAEVVLTLDNADRTAPAEFNDDAVIEVSRRIVNREDGAQSIYRINAREVRAKDVQLLFADASSGANSPSLVRQGQVADLINAKPQNRRRLLEDAAGITGLHSRRHEAELRLKAAEANLARLDDVAGELEGQKAALARAARQAVRYRNLSGDIRRAEAMAAFLRWSEAREAHDAASAALGEIGVMIEETARAAAAASTAQTAAHEELDPLRMAEAEAAAALHRLVVARETLDRDAARADAEIARIRGEIERLTADLTRERELQSDAEEASGALAREEEGLRAREAQEGARLGAAEAEMRRAGEALAAAEAELDARSAEAAALEARRKAVTGAAAEARQRVEKIRTRIAGHEAERVQAAISEDAARALETARREAVEAVEAGETAEAALQRAGERRTACEAQEAAARGPRQKAEQRRAEIVAECDALKRVLSTQTNGDWAALIECVEVAPGYEIALAAALGDDLDAAVDEEAPAHWSPVGARAAGDEPPPLPAEAAPLSRFVKAPPALGRRLASIGVVAAERGAALQATLPAGARLVSPQGDVWRWDGFVARAEAKTAAAVRLEQRNRLQGLIGDLETAVARADDARRSHGAAEAELAAAQTEERSAREAAASARRRAEAARANLSRLETARDRTSSRIAAIDAQLAALGEDRTDAEEKLAAASREADALPDPSTAAAAAAAARDVAVNARAAASEARGAHRDLSRDAETRAARLADIARERGVWSTRAETASMRLADLGERLEAAKDALATAEAEPAALNARRSRLLDAFAEAETARNAAADSLAEAVAAAAAADRTLKAAEAEAAAAREARARLEAQTESAAARVEEAAGLAQETCSAGPEALLAIAEHKDGAALPARDDVERRLERYRRERENLGGVNLRADEELQDVAARLDEMTSERNDCEAAIRKLRAAIGGINREARERLNAAFETVNTNFTRLFTRLFNGGQAELRLIESEDVLEAGLEIFASPPGKKLASMSLMSGGEQALTATALIFAVFMANPAPVCVLDEVDAPLDDTNTERFCRLLSEMANETKTRFIVITHHALTMSRMDRLFGVTMIERGVSQLVSVDLKKAAQLAAE